MLADTSRHIRNSRALIVDIHQWCDAQHLALLMRLDSLHCSSFSVIVGGCSPLWTLTTHYCNLIRFSSFISRMSRCPFESCRLGLSPSLLCGPSAHRRQTSRPLPRTPRDRIDQLLPTDMSLRPRSFPDLQLHVSSCSLLSGSGTVMT